MLYSKANLMVARVASTNPYDGALNGVVLDGDGSTVAGNGNIFLAVAPAQVGLYFPDVGPMAKIGKGVVIPPELAIKAAKIIPKDKQISLQHVAMTEAKDGRSVEFTSVDRAGGKECASLPPKRESVYDWRAIARKARSDSPLRVCVSRRGLIDMLQALEAAAPDGGDSPLYLEIGDGIIARATCKSTGQRVMGFAAAHKIDAEQWPVPDAWERSVMANPANDAKIIKRKYMPDHH
jgi:hypothetical protein